MSGPQSIRALLVEDNPGDARLTMEALRECESALFEVTEVDSLARAIAHLAGTACDVVLLDLSLPDAHGLSSFTRLHSGHPDVPVVILTGQDNEDLAVDALHEGAQDYLVKGIETFHYIGRAVRHAIERQKIERLLAASLEKAKLANRAKSEFLAAMSHELRTPLNAIIGFSEIMAQQLCGPLNNKSYLEYATSIQESGTHLLRIINDILDIAKIESGNVDLRQEWSELDEIFAAGERMVERRAEEAGITLDPAGCEGRPRLYFDRTRMLQILVNLLSNAVKFTPTGGTVSFGARLHADGDLEVYVADTGIGIAPEDIEAALTPFRQIDGSLSRKFEGTGLGLPLTRQLVELHGCELVLQSEVGIGTTVVVRFPASLVEAAGGAPRIAV